MQDFLVNSLIASIALTALINLIPRVFPGTSAEQRVRDMVGEPTEPGALDPAGSADPPPRFRIWFPWKQMIVWSLGITLVLNLIQLFD